MSSSFIHSLRLPKRNLIFAALLLMLLSLATSYYFQKVPTITNEVKDLENYVQDQEEDFIALVGDTVMMRKLVQRKESLEEFTRIGEKKYGFFLYAETLSEQNELLFWSNQRILPPLNAGFAEGQRYQRLSNGYYVIVKRIIKVPGLSSNIIAYALIPVFYNYISESVYLPRQFAHDNTADKKIALSDRKTQYVVHSIDKQPLFYLTRKAHTPILVADPITLLLRIAGLLLLLGYFQYLAEGVTRLRGAIQGTVFLAFMLILVRVLLFVFGEFFYLRQFQLFDPAVYSSNGLNRSLGDLLLNAALFCWIAVFAWHNMGPIKKVPGLLRGRRIYIAGVLALFLLIISTFELANIIKSLVADSKISFSVTNFFSLNIYSFIGFIVLALLSLTYYYFTRILFRFIFLAFERNPLIVYFIIGVVGLFYLTLQTGNSIVLFHIPVLVWLIIYTLLLSQEQFIINRFRVTMAGVLFWIFVFSVSLATVILQENRKKEHIERIDIAEKRYELTDPSQEKTLSIGLMYLDNEFLANNFYRFANESSSIIRDSIVNQNSFGSYSNSYNTKLYVFDAANEPLNNDDSRSYADLNNIYSARSIPTGNADQRYYETSLNDLFYITRKVIVNQGVLLGTVFIISTPRKYSTQGFFPELFKRNEAEFNDQIYSYAVYNKKVLTSASNKYPFQTSLSDDDIPKEEFIYRRNGTYDELWYKATNDKVVVVVKKQDSLIESITLFSYLFCAFLFMVALLQLAAYLLNTAYGWRLRTIFSRLSIRSQVHGTIIFVSILSFLIIGAATISFFVSRYNRNNIDRLSRTSDIMVREMQKRTRDQAMFDDVLKIYDSAANSNLQKLVQDISDIHNVDVNVYDLEGNLKVSSNPDFYKWGILSNKINPEAFYHLSRLRQVQHVQEETMSSLKYLSIYAAVQDENGNVEEYLNIPYFLSQIDLNQEISNFLVTIINLNAFIFLIAGVIALFITNRITRSFSIIGDKMKEVRLGKTNEEIEWNFKDEIGELVQQYNMMVRQLEQSAEALAKSEREGAWREMARQVAHEIKNPLTPMKLSIQYLQKAINNNSPNVKQLTSNVANTLVEQIDHLSKIAADFSRFANIGNKSVELFDLHQVLSSLIDLYRPNPKVVLIWNKANQQLLMSADRTHMNRLFTNLLTNAVDACEQKEKCFIKISEEIRDEHVLVRIEDNGEGIQDEMYSKIFVPNFTTKTSGTGLGLAMCKSIVEQANGTIWFETEVGKGTTFFVQLPLVNSF